MAARYEQIAHDLRERIRSGEYAPGSALPLMRDLAGERGVSDITVRKAYGMLQREGLIETRGRGGTFVRDIPDRVRLVARHRQIERDELGYYSGPEVKHWRALPYPAGDEARISPAQPLPADVADALGLSPGTDAVVRRRLVGSLDLPEHRQLADSWIPDWIAQEVPEVLGDTGAGGLYDRVEKWATRPLEWREEASARMPTPWEADALLMPRTGVPLLRTLRITTLPGRRRQPDRVVEVQDIRMSAAVFAVGYPLHRARSARWPVSPATSTEYRATAPKDDHDTE